MNHDEKNSRLRSIVEKLCKEQIFSDVDVIIEDLSKELDMDIPVDEDYDTIGGYIYSHLRSIPKDGTTKTIKTDNLTFQITKIQNRRIKEVIITKHDENKSTD